MAIAAHRLSARENMHPETSSKIGLLTTFSLLGVWIVACAVGFYSLLTYSQTPGPDLVPAALHDIRAEWPRKRDFLLVVAIHPRCVCSEATATELQRLIDKTNDKVECRVLCYQPTSAGIDFANTPLIKQLAQLPNTTMVTDSDGSMASLLGMQTSGSIALFDKEGHPLFSGGITTGRGHVGPSAGAGAIIALTSGDRPTTPRTRVYGCPLRNVEAMESEGRDL
ncbi:hypothetical protein [Aeoliella sp. SH292]|uniref:hypothetical protein n=1 Tax=Aeoliella sp. SH292 TaxID=3454464 RepID=UPI003F98FEB3